MAERTPAGKVKKHPYVGLPNRQFWKREPGIADPAAFDPVGPVTFGIGKDEAVVTAGSCFAQHVARTLSEAGFRHHITETAHPLIPEDLAKTHNYGMFAARYGNVYTARQLRQLLLRAYGEFTPVEESWTVTDRKAGTVVVDPFRPAIQPGGFASEAELLADRAQHFAAIRRAVEEMDVFVFTLGLTECFEDTRDGAVYPVAPGVSGGTWDPEIHRFRNFDVTETTEDLMAALRFVRARNPNVKIVLTVSPVPLNATYCDRHVAVSTTWSKAVLRIAAETATQELDNCVYFPSFEVITSPHTAGRYFAADRRQVTEAGVTHVMGLFLKHYGQGAGTPEPVAPAPQAAAPSSAAQADEMERIVQVLCDEEAIDN